MPVIQLELDSKGAISSLQKFDKAVDTTEVNTETSFGKMRTSVNNFGKIAGVALVAAGAAVLAIGIKSLDSASRMEEAQNKYNVVFDGMISKADEWVTELRKNYALSELAATDYLSSTKAIVDGTNMQSAAAGKLSNQVVLLAQDLASFHDKSPEQAVRAMTSALTGEYEAMKQFGVVVKKSEIIQEAMRQNTLKTKDSVTQAMEAQAAYTLILQKSGKAQGDTIRSQSSYAFQLKQTKALLEDLKVALGERLLPIATKWLTILNDWVKKEDGVNKVINFTIEAIRFVDNGIRGLVLVAKGMAVAVAGAFKAVATAVKALLFPLDAVASLAKSLGLIDTNPLEHLVSVADDFLDAQIKGFKTTLEGIEASNQKYDEMKVHISETVVKTKEHEEAQKEVTKAVEGTAEAVKLTGVAVDEVSQKYFDFSDKSKDSLIKVNGEWQNIANTTKNVTIPAIGKAKTATDEVTKAVNESTVALGVQATAADKSAASFSKIANEASKMGSLSDELGGFDTHQRSSSGSFSAHGGALSDEEWQGLAQWQKDFLIKKGLEGRTSFDYFNNKTGNRFQDAGGYDQGALAITAKSFAGTNITNVFNQQISVSDIEQITQSQTTVEARA